MKFTSSGYIYIHVKLDKTNDLVNLQENFVSKKNFNYDKTFTQHSSSRKNTT